MTRKRPIFGGIDPGKKGFLCLYDGKSIVEITKMPLANKEYDLYALDSIFKRWAKLDVRLVIMERQSVMPKEGAVGAFTSGEGFGLLKMGLYSNGVPFLTEKSRSWKKDMCIPTPAKKKVPKGASKTERGRIAREHKKDVKAESIKMAQHLFPGTDFRATERCKEPDDNKAEAALLAVLAYRRDNSIKAKGSK